MNPDRIAKQKLNIIMLVDCSTSMRGDRIKKVNSAILEIKDSLIELQESNTKVDFFITIIPYSTTAEYFDGKKEINVDNFTFDGLKAGGWSNSHLAFGLLTDILKKEKKGGIMADFGGMAPIIMWMTDGHSTKGPVQEQLDLLKKMPWYNVALKYGLAIGLDDQRTIDELQNFVADNGDVLTCFDNDKLASLIQLIVVTASKVCSTSSNTKKAANVPLATQVRHDLIKQLNDDDWEW